MRKFLTASLGAVLVATSLRRYVTRRLRPKRCGSFDANASSQLSVALPVAQKVTDWDEFTGRFEAVQKESGCQGPDRRVHAGSVL